MYDVTILKYYWTISGDLIKQTQNVINIIIIMVADYSIYI